MKKTCEGCRYIKIKTGEMGLGSSSLLSPCIICGCCRLAIDKMYDIAVAINKLFKGDPR